MYTYSKIARYIFKVCLIIFLGLQISCAEKARMTIKLPQALPEPTHNNKPPLPTDNSQNLRQQPKQIEKLQPLYLTRKNKQATKTTPTFDLPKDKLTLNAKNLPLKNFIHLALGEVLHIPFEMDPSIASRTDPINLNISKPLPAEHLLEIVEELLNSLDVSLVIIKHGLRVLPKADLKNLPPMLVEQIGKVGTGQTIDIIPLKYIDISELQFMSASIFQVGKYGRTIYNKRLNAVIVIGDRDRVKRFRDFVMFLDHRGFNQHQLRLVRPIYWQATVLAKQLINLLKVQGIPVSDSADNNNSVVVLAIESMNALLITSPQEKWLKQAEELVKQLDDADAAGPKPKTFIYFSQHRSANELGELITRAIGNNQFNDTQTTGNSPTNNNETNSKENLAQQTATQNHDLGNNNIQYKIPNLNVVIDKKRSALIIVGTAEAYQMVLPILKALDIPARQVLIEIIVADVTLNDSNKLGIEWQFDQFNIGSAIGSSFLTGLTGISGMGVTSTSSNGLTYEFIDEAIGFRALLNALATKGQAKILSSPTLLAMDGEKAHLQVGTQIPIISSETSNSASSNQNSTGLLRSFTYIDTGVILDISPTITEHGSIRMEIKQEVSDPGTRDPNGQPSVIKRLVDTVIVANSGQTILIGGLIKHSDTESLSKIPILGDIPYLGALFRTTSSTQNSTELIIMITPHIIRDQHDAEELSRSYRGRLGW